MLIKFDVIGTPKPAGSKGSFMNPKTGKIVTKDSSGDAGKTWRQEIQSAAQEAYGADVPLLIDVPLDLRIIIWRPRKASHYGTGRNAGYLKDSAPKFPTTRPDTVKLTRAIEDALTSVIWKDDSAVCRHELWKVFVPIHHWEGITVEIRDLASSGIAVLSSAAVPEIEGAQLTL